MAFQLLQRSQIALTTAGDFALQRTVYPRLQLDELEGVAKELRDQTFNSLTMLFAILALQTSDGTPVAFFTLILIAYAMNFRAEYICVPFGVFQARVNTKASKVGFTVLHTLLGLGVAITQYMEIMRLSGSVVQGLSSIFVALMPNIALILCGLCSTFAFSGSRALVTEA